jgi:hypothetical protein
MKTHRRIEFRHTIVLVYNLNKIHTSLVSVDPFTEIVTFIAKSKCILIRFLCMQAIWKTRSAL